MGSNTSTQKHSLTVDDLKPGDIIKVITYVGIFGHVRTLEVYHYGIYVGDGKVVHNKPGNGWMMSGPGGGVELCSFDEYLKMSIYRGRWMLLSKPCVSHLNIPCDCTKEHKQHSPELTSERALQRVGEKRFHLRKNNSEHFVMECRFGVHASDQLMNTYLNKAFFCQPIIY